ncbi:MAG: quinolinate phosphoribosyl transferase [Gemmatimonadales bacterium]|nr:MAG: quinolinate phosphoribosyl transferase [Gemmatimonadales bacterium]
MPPLPAPIRHPERLDPAIFDLPVERMRAGYYSDKYFVRAREVLQADGRDPVVTMQVFQKKRAWVAGTDEAVAILRRCLSPGYVWSDLEVKALRDGDRVDPWETVLEVTGPYAAFAHLETLYLGALARRTAIATRTREVVEAAWPKRIMFFPARHDHWRVQTGDGWAAHVAGAIGVSTDAQASWWGSEGIGTVPHALISAYGGDTVAATRAFARHMDDDVNVVSLVDFDNESVETSLAVARALGARLYGVRLDTSGHMVDRAVFREMGDFDPRGVNPRLVRLVRDALDREGFSQVKIVCSGGFDAPKIRRFEALGVPVDSYGVGSSLVRGDFDYTADVVLVDGEPAAKEGRWHRPNPRLEVVD